MDKRVFSVSAIFLIGLNLLLMAEERWWDVLPENKKSPYKGGHIEGVECELEKKVLTQDDFKNWVQYEDEYVAFNYPKHPLIQLEVQKPEKGISVEGGVCTTVDNSFQQAYVLKVGERTYAVMLLNPAAWLDDGICLCGPMAHHAYRVNDGTVTRFSLLPSGAVKKAQVVGGGLRFMAFEWTHLVCPRAIYERMVNSMRLKTKNKKGDEYLKSKLVDEYGIDAALGLIQRGQDAQVLVDIFGEPQQKGKRWRWSWVGEDYPMTLDAEIEVGKYVGLPEGGIIRDTENPVYGSVAWCEFLLEKMDGSSPQVDEDPFDNKNELVGGEEYALDKKGRAVMVRKITGYLEQTRGLKGDFSDSKWFHAVYLANEAQEHGVYNDQWTSLIRDNALGYWPEIVYMEKVRPEGVDEWCVSIIQRVENGDIESLTDEGLRDLALLLSETNENMWRRLVSEWWLSENLQVKQLVFAVPTLLEERVAENWVIEVLGDVNIEAPSSLVYQALKVIPFIKFSDPERLKAAVEKLPEGRGKSSRWARAKTKALTRISEESDRHQ